MANEAKTGNRAQRRSTSKSKGKTKNVNLSDVQYKQLTQAVAQRAGLEQSLRQAMQKEQEIVELILDAKGIKTALSNVKLEGKKLVVTL